MAANTLWCVFGALILTSSLVAGSYTPAPDPRSKCKLVVIRSSIHDDTIRLIKDDNDRPADIIKVTVERTLSAIKCVLDDTVVVLEPYIHVKKGCQAELKVCYKIVDGPEPTVRPGCKLVRLLSRQNRVSEEVQSSKILSMRIIRQFPEGSSCERKENFGFSGKTAFAKKGCRADFEVCLKDYLPSEEPVCEQLVLTSTARIPEVRRIVDVEGNTAAVVSVKLVTQISGVICEESRSFFYNDTHVTVKFGCVGRFKVCYVSSGPGPETTLPSGCISVRLLSTRNNSVKKTIADEDSDFKSIRVQKQFSEVDCIFNDNFGFRDGDVYASGGCRADFLVCLTGPLPVTELPATICINVLLASWSRDESDWKKVSGRGGAPVKVTSIRLLRQESTEPCLKKRSYYIREPDEVHSIRGCRGTFRVCYVILND